MNGGWHDHGGDGSSDAEPLRVLGVPAFSNRELNPYNALLYQAMIRTGVVVDELTPRNLVGGRYDIVHVHWPEHLFSAPGGGRTMFQAIAFIAVVSWLRWRGTKMVWTVHNVVGHQRSHRWLETRMWRWFVNRVDGYIALSHGGREAALTRYPTLACRPGFVIPHGHYRGAYPDTIDRDDARTVLRLPRNANVVCFFGAIRPYKNVSTLIESVRAIPSGDWRLVIAGHVRDHRLGAELRDRMRGDPRVQLHVGFVPHDRVQTYFRAADLVILPYREILNSGSAILALSFGVPVLVPAKGAMADLRHHVGDDWVRTYDGRLSAPVLQAAMRWARTARRESRPPLAEFAWDRIARQTCSAYEAVRGPEARLPEATH